MGEGARWGGIGAKWEGGREVKRVDGIGRGREGGDSGGREGIIEENRETGREERKRWEGESKKGK